MTTNRTHDPGERRDLTSNRTHVIPANAGISVSSERDDKLHAHDHLGVPGEIPAFAGMTGAFAGMTGAFAGMTGLSRDDGA